MAETIRLGENISDSLGLRDVNNLHKLIYKNMNQNSTTNVQPQIANNLVSTDIPTVTVPPTTQSLTNILPPVPQSVQPVTETKVVSGPILLVDIDFYEIFGIQLSKQTSYMIIGFIVALVLYYLYINYFTEKNKKKKRTQEVSYKEQKVLHT